VRRRGDTPTTVGLEVVKRTTTIKVSMKATAAGNKTSGWYFFAWAAM
jgi:hypothetical protein